MVMPSFVGAGAGVTVATGTATVNKMGCTAGNFLILQVMYDGTAGDWGIGTYVNMLNLAGAAGSTFVTSTGIGNPVTANFSVFFARATADGTCSVNLTVGASGEDLFLRLYELTDVALGTDFGGVAEANNSGTGTSTALAASSHTSTGADRLAVELIGINAAQACADFTGETGGDWTLAVTEYQGTGTVGTIALQTAQKAAAGSLSGGSFAISSAAWGTWGAMLLPGPDPPVPPVTPPVAWLTA